VEGFVLGGEVAVLVGGGGADEAAVDGKAGVEQLLLAVEVQQLHEVLGGAGGEPAAVVARVDEGVQADARDHARLAAGDGTEEVGDHPLRPVVGLDLVALHQVAQARGRDPVPADHAPDQARMAEVVDAAPAAIALAGGIQQREITRRGLGLEAAFDGRGHRLGMAGADKAGGGDRPAVLDQGGGLGRGDDLHGAWTREAAKPPSITPHGIREVT
jgi:hypothetical protein